MLLQAPNSTDAPRTAPWTVAVLGPGGIGGLLAAILARGGHRVICLAGEETVGKLRGGGIRLASTNHGDFRMPVEAASTLDERVDLCLVTVKSTALEAALHRVPADVLGTSFMVPLLNGVEHLTTLRARYPAADVVPAIIRAESTRTSPGVIVHGSPFTEIDLAGSVEHLHPLASRLTRVGIETRVQPDEAGVMWAKLAFLAPFALLTTRYRAPIGTIRTKHREALEVLVSEATAVSAACGVPLNRANILARYDRFPYESKSSMQRDAEAGRPLELDAIGGALVRAAERHGVSVPLATRLCAELTRVE